MTDVQNTTRYKKRAGLHRRQMRRSQRRWRAHSAKCAAMVAKQTTAEIVESGYFRGHPVVSLAGEDCERYADDLTPTEDEQGNTVERPCGLCGLLAEPDGPDPCLGTLGGVESACCGHGVEQTYLVFRFAARGRKVLSYFSKLGVGPHKDEDTRANRHTAVRERMAQEPEA